MRATTLNLSEDNRNFLAIESGKRGVSWSRIAEAAIAEYRNRQELEILLRKIIREEIAVIQATLCGLKAE